MEHDIQQYWNETQQKEAQEYTKAQMEVAQGKAQAKAYHLAAAADMFKAVGSMALAFAGGAPGSSLASEQAAGDLAGNTFTPTMSRLITTIN